MCFIAFSSQRKAVDIPANSQLDGGALSHVETNAIMFARRVSYLYAIVRDCSHYCYDKRRVSIYMSVFVPSNTAAFRNTCVLLAAVVERNTAICVCVCVGQRRRRTWRVLPWQRC